MRSHFHFPRRRTLQIAALSIALTLIVGLFACVAAAPPPEASVDRLRSEPVQVLPYVLALGAVAPLAMRRGDYDSEVNKTHALPNGAATTQSAAGINLGVGERSCFVADAELLISAPALTTAELPDGQTITYSLEFDDAAAFGSIDETMTLFVQTGAGGAGAAAVERRIKPSSLQALYYVRLKTVKTGAANASTKSATLALKY